MKIILAEHYGMCFGVRDAIKKAEEMSREGPFTILGELVHNPVVRNRLAASGAAEGNLERDQQVVATKNVMITAHGASDRHRQEWQAAGYNVVDTTCPLVRRAHDRLRTLVAAGHHPVVIGKRDHVEVKGLTGDFPDAVVLESELDFHLVPKSARRLGVVAQTTQPVERVRLLVERLQAAFPDREIRFVDTVCQPTKDRQEAVQELLQQVEVVVVVGGRNSNNTRQLVLACEAAGVVAHHVEHARQVEPDWFAGVERVGITAGTSSLEETVQQVKQRIEQIAVAVERQAGRLRAAAVVS